MDFELDSKMVVDSLQFNKDDFYESGDIIRTAHLLAKATLFLVSFQIWVEISNFIEHIIISEMI